VAEQHLDPTFLRDAVAQIARHRAFEAVRSHHEVHVSLSSARESAAWPAEFAA
jgi:hypothetical protein